MMTDDFSRLGWLRYKVQAEFKELIWALLGFLQLDMMVAFNFLIAAVCQFTYCKDITSQQPLHIKFSEHYPCQYDTFMFQHFPV